MRILRTFFIMTTLILVVQGCKVTYSLSGADIGNAKTFQVNNFINNAAVVEPRVARDFTLALQDILLNQTSLSITNNNADLIYEGEIVQYYVAPITATAQSTAAQNRLTMAVNVRFFNTLEPEKDFEQRFSFYVDFDGQALLTGSRLDDVLSEIFERITQDIFNRSLANW